MKATLKISILLAMFIPAVPLCAADASVVSFFVGKVTVETGEKSVPVKVGMVLPEEGTIKTGAGSFAEIRIGSHIVTVKQNQSVKCRALKSVSAGADKSISAIRKVMKEYSAKDQYVTVAAVRADKKKDDTVQWDTGEPDAPQSLTDDAVYKQIQESADRDDFSSAVSVYEKYVHDGGIPEEKTMFLAAFSYQQLCRYSEALSLFEKVVLNAKDAEGALNATVSAGMVSYCIADYVKTVTLMSAYLDKDPGGSLVPQALFFRGMSYKFSSQIKKADADFRRLSESYPREPLGQVAAGEMTRKGK